MNFQQELACKFGSDGMLATLLACMPATSILRLRLLFFGCRRYGGTLHPLVLLGRYETPWPRNPQCIVGHPTRSKRSTHQGLWNNQTLRFHFAGVVSSHISIDELEKFAALFRG